MRYADQHVHTACSRDSDVPMRVMAENARARGMAAICFTDHIDMADAVTGANDPDYPALWDAGRAMRRELRENPTEGIELRFGMELGEALQMPELSRKAAEEEELDFVLGSLHNLPDTPDFYFYRYTSEAECRALNHRYLAALRALADFPAFDVMAHVGYTARYMRRAGFTERIEADGEYRDELADILSALISQGRGIEVNASGLRTGDTTYPSESILRLYRDLGGEVLTVGGDAHKASDVGVGIPEAYELLRSLGFRYVAEFIRRKPRFTALDT